MGENAIALTPVEEWTTEPEYEFGDVFEGDALFAGLADVDVSPDGSRIYVVDYAASEVTIWTPDGSLVRRFGQEGEGPGDFLAPGDLTLRDDALTVRDRRGFTTFLQSQRNTEFVFPVAGGDQRFFLIQPWIRPDICRGDGATGSAVCARTQTMPPGVAEFVEISATGDTLWSRRIQLPPMPVEDHEFAAHLEQVASMISRSSEGDSIASPRVKRRLREALIVPEFWPAIRGFRLMPNGEVWFRRLKDGASHVWYAVTRGETEGPIRRIVLPEPFRPRGVTRTHVWGDRRDEMDVQYVAGLRLVRAEG